MNNSRAGQGCLSGGVINGSIVDDDNFLNAIYRHGSDHITNCLGFIEGWNDDGYFHFMSPRVTAKLRRPADGESAA